MKINSMLFAVYQSNSSPGENDEGSEKVYVIFTII